MHYLGLFYPSLSNPVAKRSPGVNTSFRSNDLPSYFTVHLLNTENSRNFEPPYRASNHQNTKNQTKTRNNKLSEGDLKIYWYIPYIYSEAGKKRSNYRSCDKNITGDSSVCLKSISADDAAANCLKKTLKKVWLTKYLSTNNGHNVYWYISRNITKLFILEQ